MIMIELAKGLCENVFNNYEHLKMAERGIYSCAAELIHELFTGEEGEQILENIMDGELCNHSLDNRNEWDSNTWEHWTLDKMQIENSHVFLIYHNEVGAEFRERLEHTDIVFLGAIVQYIKRELDKIEN